MDIQYYGANCITLTVKGARVVIDDNLADLGGKTINKAGDIVLYTGAAHGTANKEARIVIDSPGEYEVADVSIVGIPARAHMDEGGLNATMYKVTVNDMTVFITGHIYPDLSDRQLETIGMVDVMFVPVGGHGYTLDPIGALKVLKAVEPKIVIPTHYEEKGVNFEVGQTDLKSALHELSMEPKETVAKLRLKPVELTDTTQLIVLEKS